MICGGWGEGSWFREFCLDVDLKHIGGAGGRVGSEEGGLFFTHIL